MGLLILNQCIKKQKNRELNVEMKIASWNINSIRARQDAVTDWINQYAPDVLCLQETKVKNEQFPKEAFEELGYHLYIHGQPAYNGVAFFSKHEMKDVVYGMPNQHDDDQQKRFIAGTVDGVHIINIYAPNGQAPDKPAFEFKERWYATLNEYLIQAMKNHEHVLICGDFNIAPHDDDVWNPEKLLGKCGFHPSEHEWFQGVMDLGLEDVVRQKIPDGKLYSWWDYRQGALRQDRGMRIDHILTTPALAKKCTNAEIDKNPRTGERPSDHVPVIGDFDV